jgi:hypothetical protein
MTPQTLAEAKALAKALRQAMAAQGKPLTQAQALEEIAHQHGARDWNTLHARLSTAPPPPPPSLALHDAVQGHYLGQPFTGRIIALAKSGPHTNLSIQLDQAIDTVRFESFSNLRRQIRGMVDENGRSPAQTSDGEPHLLVQRRHNPPGESPPPLLKPAR